MFYGTNNDVFYSCLSDDFSSGPSNPDPFITVNHKKDGWSNSAERVGCIGWTHHCMFPMSEYPGGNASGWHAMVWDSDYHFVFPDYKAALCWIKII